jgi:hypothetical protein
MSTLYGGIDPGKDGCLATIDKDDGSVMFFDTPTAETVKAGKTKLGNERHKRIYLAHEMAHQLRHLKQRLISVTIEEALAMPGKAGRPMPAQSALETGLGFGIWLGILVALEIPFRRVHPATWKAALLAGQPKIKEAVVPFVCNLYPQAAPYLRGPKGGLLVDRADATLIAHWGKTQG